MKHSVKIAVCALAACSLMGASAEFSAGYAKLDITPPLGTPLAGYATKRISDGVLDPLDAVAVAFSDGTNRAVVISADIINLRAYFNLYRKGIAKATGLDPQAVFIACTHTHTGPMVGACTYGQTFNDFSRAGIYEKSLTDRFASVAQMALSDLSPATLATARGEAKGISFIRRYRMKDGTCQTNPGIGNPDIVAPIGEPDEQVQLVRVDRPGKDSIAIVNFQCHPDTIGGNRISADWPRVVRETVERTLDGVKCIFINGAQGDSNHICTDPNRAVLKGKRNRLTYVHMGRVVAGAVIGMWDVCVPAKAGKVGFGIATARVKTSRVTDAAEIAESRRLMALVRAGKFSEIPGKGMMKNTVMAKARRIEYLADGPDHFDFPLSAVTVGDTLAFVGFPGEPFTEYGVLVKKGSPFAMTIPACLVNGSFGYLPVDSAFKEEGYETQGSLFAEGLEKAMVGGHLEQLRKLVDGNR